MEAEIGDDGLMALKELEDIDGLQITLPAAKSMYLVNTANLSTACGQLPWWDLCKQLTCNSFALESALFFLELVSCAINLKATCPVGSKAKRQRKGKKKGGKDESEEEVEEDAPTQEGKGKGKKGKRKKKGDAKAEEEEVAYNTDDEIWKQYGSDADLDAPYVPKVYSFVLGL